MKMCPFRQIKELQDVTTLEALVDLLRYRETVLFTKLVEDNKSLLTAGKSKYQILMRETSDVQQQLAQVYGERHCLEYCIYILSTIKNQENKDLMSKVFRLYGAEIVQRELTFFIIQGVIGKKAVNNLTPTRHALIKDIAARATDLLDCMNIPKHALYAPIAANYLKYNESANQGEVIGAKM